MHFVEYIWIQIYPMFKCYTYTFTYLSTYPHYMYIEPSYKSWITLLKSGKVQPVSIYYYHYYSSILLNSPDSSSDIRLAFACFRTVNDWKVRKKGNKNGSDEYFGSSNGRLFVKLKNVSEWICMHRIYEEGKSWIPNFSTLRKINLRICQQPIVTIERCILIKKYSTL